MAEVSDVAGIVTALTSALGHLHGLVAAGLVGALVFGETAIFLGFVLPGEAAVVLGGVLASRGHLSLGVLIAVVVVTAVTGPLVGYEIGRRMGDRLFASRALSRVPGAVGRARVTLRDRGGLAVLGGRFVAIVRALMPAAAGAARMPYRTLFLAVAAWAWRRHRPTSDASPGTTDGTAPAAGDEVLVAGDEVPAAGDEVPGPRGGSR